ncbi:MAG: PEP-CTERM sorting domain-containing protein [Rhizobacter sp.]
MTDLNVRLARGPRAVALAALLSCAAAAHADPTTYLLNLSGGGTHFLDAWECPGQRCDTGAIRFSWEGRVTVIVDSAGPGTFSGDHLLGLSLTTFEPGFIEGFSRPVAFSPPSVTVMDGHVTSIDIDWAGLPEIFRFSGLTVGYSKEPTHHLGSTFASAVLTPIPEPASWALLAGGLAMLGAARARRASTG